MTFANVVPDKYLKRIQRELMKMIPAAQGKVSVTFEVSCGAGGVVNGFKVKRYEEDEER